MGENNYTKLIYIACFIVLAAISCWATSESFRLLLPTWPPIICWLITIAFFVVASYGTKLIVDSCNKDIYMEKRGTSLIIGVILILCFWLVCSMPTNTHTFFYRSYIDNKVSTDISKTQGYLAQIKNNTKIDQLIQAQCTDLDNKVNMKLGDLRAEIDNEVNPGFGPKSKEILKDMAEILGVAKIDPLSHANGAISKQQRQMLNDGYRQKILELAKSKKENIKLSLTPTNNEYRRVAETDYKNLNYLRQYVQDGTLDVNDPQDIKTVCDKLNQGYNTVNTYRQYVIFQSEEDEAQYTSANPETRVRRMLNVYDVWMDFIHGEFPGSFIFWIVISILVDVAAFLFFDFAFKRTEF